MEQGYLGCRDMLCTRAGDKLRCVPAAQRGAGESLPVLAESVALYVFKHREPCGSSPWGRNPFEIWRTSIPPG